MPDGVVGVGLADCPLDLVHAPAAEAFSPAAPRPWRCRSGAARCRSPGGAAWSRGRCRRRSRRHRRPGRARGPNTRPPRPRDGCWIQPLREVFIAGALVGCRTWRPVQVEGIEGLKALQGETIGPSEWREVTQRGHRHLRGPDRRPPVDPHRRRAGQEGEPVRDDGRPRQPDPVADRRPADRAAPVDRLQARRQLRLEQGPLPGARAVRQPGSAPPPRWSRSTTSAAAGGRSSPASRSKSKATTSPPAWRTRSAGRCPNSRRARDAQSGGWRRISVADAPVPRVTMKFGDRTRPPAALGYLTVSVPCMPASLMARHRAVERVRARLQVHGRVRRARRDQVGLTEDLPRRVSHGHVVLERLLVVEVDRHAAGLGADALLVEGQVAAGRGGDVDRRAAPGRSAATGRGGRRGGRRGRASSSCRCCCRRRPPGRQRPAPPRSALLKLVSSGHLSLDAR